MYWPLVNTVMYSMVRPRYMNLYADVCALFFASLMSYITYNDCGFAVCPDRSDLKDSVTQAASSSVAALSNFISDIRQTHTMHLLTLLNDGQRVEAMGPAPSKQT